MGDAYCLYSISPADVGDRVDLESLGPGRSWVRGGGKAPAWAEELATRTEAHDRTVDPFDAGERLFGKHVRSVAMNPYDSSLRFKFDDGTSELVDHEALEPFYRDEVFDAYVYDARPIGETPSFPCPVDLGGHEAVLLDEETACALLEAFMAEYAEELDDEYAGAGYLRPVYALARAMLAIRKGEHVICQVA